MISHVGKNGAEVDAHLLTVCTVVGTGVSFTGL
jgi:hypothetical protein